MMDEKEATYAHVCKLERPLESIRNLGMSLALITETIEEPGASAMNEIIQAMLERVEEIDREYAFLFRLHHPSREQFKRDGRWPDETG
jgi:hypothetical protein